VILFGAIPAIIPVIPEVPAEVPIVPANPLVALEAGADSIPPTLELPLVLPFLCSDDSEADSGSEPAKKKPKMHESLIVHDIMVSRWRDRVTSRPSSPSGSSSHDTFAPSFEFPVALVIATPGIRRWPRILIRPMEAIPFGRPYYTHPNRPSKLLTARKRVGPFPARRLAWRYFFIFTFRFIVRHIIVYSSGCDASGQTHSGPSTRVASSRLVYPPVMTLRYSKAFSRWRSAPLSTPYPPTTSKSSPNSFSERSMDSSSLFVRPSCKRCKTPTTLVPSSTPISRSIAYTHADILPPRKRFRYSYSPEDSREEHMEIGTADVEAIADLGIGDRVGAHTEDGICMGVEIAASDIREDEEEFEAEAHVGGTIKIAVDPLVTGGISESTRGDVPWYDGFKEAQLLSMAGIRALKSLTEETQERRAEDLALSINRRL
ncbi:hypothetical protein Tco_1332818, partial [Tanacetum coccineum]